MDQPTEEDLAADDLRRRMIYGTCVICGAARDVSRSVVDGVIHMSLWCPGCGAES